MRRLLLAPLAVAALAGTVALAQTPPTVRISSGPLATPPPDDRTATLNYEKKRLRELLDAGWRPESERVQQIKTRIAALEAEIAARRSRPAPRKPAPRPTAKPSPAAKKRG